MYTLLRKLQAKNECLLLEDLAQSCVRGKAGGKEKDVAKGQTRYMYRSKCAHIERDLDAAFRTPGASSRELCVCAGLGAAVKVRAGGGGGGGGGFIDKQRMNVGR